MVRDLLQEGKCVKCSSSAEKGSSRSEDPHQGKIPDMESVVATITGYSGDERSNLIKLINTSGGYYVGKLSRDSTTHLVCWTFDGPKYEMAKRFGIHIVNHRFFEESFKEGKRLNESSYSKLSGKQVGAVLWKAPMQVSIHSKSVAAENFCEAIPDCNSLSVMELGQTLSEEILEFSDGDKDLQILLKNQPKKRDKGKRKASLIVKNQSLRNKVGKKGTKSSIASASRREQMKLEDIKNRVSHSMLEYVYIKDEIDIDDNLFTPVPAHNNLTAGIHAGLAPPDIWVSRSTSTKIPQLEVFEDCYPANIREWKQKSLSDFNSLRHRKKQRLVRKTDAVSPACASNGVVLCEIDMAHSPSSVEAVSRAEILDEEPASPNISLHADAACLTAHEHLTKSPVACTLVAADIACVICHTDKINSAEGVLTCGHCFCYPCIEKWASEVASKTPTCPLCKAPFDMITKREQQIGLDDEEVSYEERVVLLSSREMSSSEQLGDISQRIACIMCGVGDTEELLLTCIGCGTRSAHTFCLDPPLPPVPNASWFCGRCSQRRRADTTWWHQLHVFEGLED